jgi:hypothetical protein
VVALRARSWWCATSTRVLPPVKQTPSLTLRRGPALWMTKTGEKRDSCVVVAVLDDKRRHRRLTLSPGGTGAPAPGLSPAHTVLAAPHSALSPVKPLQGAGSGGESPWRGRHARRLRGDTPAPRRAVALVP